MFESIVERAFGCGQSGDADTEAASATHLTVDEMFDVLRNERRRLVLQALREGGPVLPKGDLAEIVAAVESEGDRDGVSAQQRKRVYIPLHQVHLPQLADAGVVEYDERSGDVRLCAAADPLFEQLDLADEQVVA
jgi:DNA-binding transcriptional ArsR family regulator